MNKSLCEHDAVIIGLIVFKMFTINENLVFSVYNNISLSIIFQNRPTTQRIFLVYRKYNLEINLHQNTNRVLIVPTNQVAILSISQTHLI